MSDQSDGGAAFPLSPAYLPQLDNINRSGMSLRDYFASAVVSNLARHYPNETVVEVAETAYMIADAMLMAREK